MSSRGKVIAFGAVALVVAVSGLVLARYFSSAKKQEETKRPQKDIIELPKKSREYLIFKNEKDKGLSAVIDIIFRL
jgi:glucose uptake protein GlcU